MNKALPNVLTSLRLVAIPVLVLFLAMDQGEQGRWRWWALVVFLVAAATDFFDGFFARRWQTVSDFGKLADPIADKLLVLTTLALVVVYDQLAVWPLAVLVVREVLVTWGRLVMAGSTVMEASWGGKVKTTLQLAALTFLLVPHGPEWLTTAGWWCLVAAVVVAIVTGVDYARQMWRLHRMKALS